jgi:hypothetical protein
MPTNIKIDKIAGTKNNGRSKSDLRAEGAVILSANTDSSSAACDAD